MTVDFDGLLTFAFRQAPRLPGPVVQGAFALAADVAWLAHGRGVRQLEANLARVRPAAGRRALRRLSRAGMQSYFRYYAEVLRQPALTAEQIDARVRPENIDWVRKALAEGRTVVVALGHSGNFDLAGAWASRHLGPVATVAERLEPEQVFRDFLAVRERAGLHILPLGRGDGGQVFRGLARLVRDGAWVMPLLADRDLTSHGVEVQLFGQTARVAAGPAALAAGGRADLCAGEITYERLDRSRRRRAGARWGIVVRLSDPVRPVPAARARDQIPMLTQAWVDLLAQVIEQHPQDWHMLQKVFVADLDPTRYAAVAGGGS